MIGFLRLLVLLLIVLSVLYVLVAIYARSLARERLERRWEAKPHAGRREDFIAAGLRLYDKSARRRLLGAIWIVPPVTIAVLIWLTNFN
ncbi:hypothetical protein [Falsigemmobacter faecalis]|uniref:Cation/multidrug efflux pump n=1 Tax=Falsigemmobacter faecalis TaxID=2488730 RepID=A0A3P3DW39_9RHOB|nr:hypothetical protein [Falsigemmobacter faecalis]RRH78483.1 hypothetical protein EG244_00570 [Falsigemmobacter faecalis]